MAGSGPMMRATAIGFLAVLSWALLALLTVASGQMPPFQLASCCFAVGAVIGFADMARRGVTPGRLLYQPWPVWLVGVGGLFGYHFLYFTALRNAPPAQAGLIAYLWPLLIVLMASLLPGERLRAGHLLGAAMAFGGVAVLLGPEAASFSPQHAAGYAAACACALVWSSYSVVSRRLGSAPTDTVAIFCLISSLLAAVCHLMLEQTLWPSSTGQWLAILGLGLGPVGGAFYAWDAGVKHGDIQLLGTAAYAAPLLSTVALVLAGVTPATSTLAIATVLITAGAALAGVASASRRNAG